jgi:hypothetical protein
MAQQTHFPASDFPPLTVEVLKNKHKNRETGTSDVRAGYSGRYGGMTVVTKGNKTMSRVVVIVDLQDSSQRLSTDLENVVIARGHPIQAHHGTSLLRGLIQIRKNDKGYIELLEPDERIALVTIPKDDRSGWVTTNAIDIGTERAYGDWAYQYLTSPIPDREHATLATTQEDTSLLAKTMMALLDKCSSGEALTRINNDTLPLLSSPSKRAWVVRLAIDGFKRAGTYNIMKDGRFTIQQLIRAAADAKLSRAAGTYFRFYVSDTSNSRVTGKDSIVSNIYLGSTKLMLQRMQKHHDTLPKSDGLHGRAHKCAHRMYCRVLCDVDENACQGSLDGVLFLIEQLMVFMFGSYSNSILGTSQSKDDIIASKEKTGVDASLEGLAELEEAAEESYNADDIEMQATESKGPKASAKKAMLKQMSLVSVFFLRLGESTCDAVGWEPLTGRADWSTGGDGIGTTPLHGLNISSPACSMFTTIFITKFTKGDGTVIYRKPPTTVEDTIVCTIGSKKSPNCDHYNITRASWSGHLPKGTKVHTVFEISPNGRPHPKSWLGLPTTCLFEDSSRAETLAIMIEWKNEAGKFQSEYLRYSHSPLWFNENVTGGYEGQYNGFGIAIGILNFLEGREPVQNRRQFVRHFGAARIIEVHVNHLRQLVQLSILPAPLHRTQDAGMRSRAEIHQELVVAGAHNIDLTFGTFSFKDPSAVRYSRNRTKCDRCLISYIFSESKESRHESFRAMCHAAPGSKICTASPKPGSNRCLHCERAGIDCTYTTDIGTKPELCRALWFRQNANEIFSDGDPQYVTVAEYPDDDEQDATNRPRTAAAAPLFELASSQSAPLFRTESRWMLETGQPPVPNPSTSIRDYIPTAASTRDRAPTRGSESGSLRQPLASTRSDFDTYRRPTPAPIRSLFDRYEPPAPSDDDWEIETKQLLGLDAPSQRPAPTQSRSTYGTYEPPAPSDGWEIETRQPLGFDAPSQGLAPAPIRSTYGTYQPAAPTYGGRTRSTTLRTTAVAHAPQSLAPSYSSGNLPVPPRDYDVPQVDAPSAPISGRRRRSTLSRAQLLGQEGQDNPTYQRASSGGSHAYGIAPGRTRGDSSALTAQILAQEGQDDHSGQDTIHVRPRASTGGYLSSPHSGDSGSSQNIAVRPLTGTGGMYDGRHSTLTWTRPQGDMRLSSEDFPRAAYDNHANVFNGHVSSRWVNGSLVTKTAYRIIMDFLRTKFDDWKETRRYNPSDTAAGRLLRRTKSDIVVNAFNTLRELFEHTKTKNLLDAADWLAQVALKLSGLDLWDPLPEQSDVLWAKPLPRKRASSGLVGYYDDNAFKGQMDPRVPNSAMASQTAAQLIRDVFIPLLEDLRQSRRGTGTRDLAVARVVARFRDMGSLFLQARSHNLLDAGDWIAQKVYFETSKDIWVGNSEKDLEKAPARLQWKKPGLGLRKDSSRADTDYTGGTYRGNVLSSHVPNIEWASRDARDLITSILSPAIRDLRAAHSDNQTDESQRAVRRLFRSLRRVFHEVRTRNLLDAGDWLAQKALDCGMDLWRELSDD